MGNGNNIVSWVAEGLSPEASGIDDGGREKTRGR